MAQINDSTLFDAPVAHRGDPVTSYKAGDRAIKSERLKGQMRLVAMGVTRWPGRTSAELAVVIGLNRYDTARRLPTLQHRGLVKKGASRLCKTCGSECVTWWPTAEAGLFGGGR